MLGNSSIVGLYCYDTSISSPSDKRVKRDVNKLSEEDLLNFVNDLEPITYKKKNPADWDDEIKIDDFKSLKERKKFDKNAKKVDRPEDNNKKYTGLIAQDVEKSMKKFNLDYELVQTFDNGMKTLRYGDFITALIGAVKAQQKQINELKDNINKLTNI